MRISDWSSDVCSSDRLLRQPSDLLPGAERRRISRSRCHDGRLHDDPDVALVVLEVHGADSLVSEVRAREGDAVEAVVNLGVEPVTRSEERRVGKGCARTCSSRGWPTQKKNKHN